MHLLRRPLSLWTIAFLLTLASAVYQRVTGPSYPARGSVRLAGAEIGFRLPRTQGDGDAVVSVAAPAGVQGSVSWKRFRSGDGWTTLPMERQGQLLAASLPHQPPAGKLAYRVVLTSGTERVALGGQAVVLRFKGEVPRAVLVVHIFCMFFGMLLSTRAGLEFFRPAPRYLTLILPTIGLLTVGGLLLGPIVQKHAFGAYWTGWPFGTDLTDNKTLVAWLGWVAAWLRIRRNPAAGAWALIAAAVTLIVFGIPHSMFGSELKYD